MLAASNLILVERLWVYIMHKFGFAEIAGCVCASRGGSRTSFQKKTRRSTAVVPYAPQTWPNFGCEKAETPAMRIISAPSDKNPGDRTRHQTLALSLSLSASLVDRPQTPRLLHIEDTTRDSLSIHCFRTCRAAAATRRPSV